MNAIRTQAIHIITELPEPYIAYALEILKNVRQMSNLGMAAQEKKTGFPAHFREREDGKEIQATIEAIIRGGDIRKRGCHYNP